MIRNHSSEWNPRFPCTKPPRPPHAVYIFSLWLPFDWFSPYPAFISRGVPCVCGLICFLHQNGTAVSDLYVHHLMYEPCKLPHRHPRNSFFRCPCHWIRLASLFFSLSSLFNWGHKDWVFFFRPLNAHILSLERWTCLSLWIRSFRMFTCSYLRTKHP